MDTNLPTNRVTYRHGIGTPERTTPDSMEISPLTGRAIYQRRCSNASTHSSIELVEEIDFGFTTICHEEPEAARPPTLDLRVSVPTNDEPIIEVTGPLIQRPVTQQEAEGSQQLYPKTIWHFERTVGRHVRQ